MAEYPTLDEARAAGLFHPNCRHSISLYQEGITRPMKNTADPEGYRQSQKVRYYESRKTREQRRRAAAFTPDARRASAQRAAVIDRRLDRANLEADIPGLEQATHRWQAQQELGAVTGMQSAAKTELAGGHATGPWADDARALLQGIDASPVVNKPLHRVLAVDNDTDIEDLFGVGSTHNMGIEAFTGLKDFRDDFALMNLSPGVVGGDETFVLLDLKGGGRALDIDGDGIEFLASGEMRVTSLERVRYLDTDAWQATIERVEVPKAVPKPPPAPKPKAEPPIPEVGPVPKQPSEALSYLDTDPFVPARSLDEVQDRLRVLAGDDTILLAKSSTTDLGGRARNDAWTLAHSNELLREFERLHQKYPDMPMKAASRLCAQDTKRAAACRQQMTWGGKPWELGADHQNALHQTRYGRQYTAYRDGIEHLQSIDHEFCHTLQQMYRNSNDDLAKDWAEAVFGPGMGHRFVIRTEDLTRAVIDDYRRTVSSYLGDWGGDPNEMMAELFLRYVEDGPKDPFFDRWPAVDDFFKRLTEGGYEPA